MMTTFPFGLLMFCNKYSQAHVPKICESFFENPGKQELNLNGASFLEFVLGSRYGMVCGTEL